MSTFAAGRRNKRVEFQSPIYEVDTNTGNRKLIDWQSEGFAWVSIEPLSAREFVSADMRQAGVDVRITGTYRAGILPTWRIVRKDAVYNIAGALPDPDSGAEHMTFPCSTGTNDGQ